MPDVLTRLKVAFTLAFLRAIRDAIVARPKIRFGSGFVVTESDGEILVDVAGSSKPKD